MPEELTTALKGADFNGKIIKPFVTHEGSGLASIPKQNGTKKKEKLQLV